jgi:hypothetical protein
VHTYRIRIRRNRRAAETAKENVLFIPNLIFGVAK